MLPIGDRKKNPREGVFLGSKTAERTEEMKPSREELPQKETTFGAQKLGPAPSYGGLQDILYGICPRGLFQKRV